MEQYGIAGAVVVLVGFLFKVIVTPIIRLVRPQAANDLADIKAELKAIRCDIKDHRSEVKVEMEKRRQVEIKLFDRADDLGQRVSHMEGIHRAGGND